MNTGEAAELGSLSCNLVRISLAFTTRRKDKQCSSFLHMNEPEGKIPPFSRVLGRKHGKRGPTAIPRIKESPRERSLWKVWHWEVRVSLTPCFKYILKSFRCNKIIGWVSWQKRIWDGYLHTDGSQGIIFLVMTPMQEWGSWTGQKEILNCDTTMASVIQQGALGLEWPFWDTPNWGKWAVPSHGLVIICSLLWSEAVNSGEASPFGQK